jgi:hypothetical protein
MGWGLGVGFVRATSDNEIRVLRHTFSSATVGTYYTPFKIAGTNTNYQVPTNKTAVIALERTLSSETRGGTVEFGYADDTNGTNFVSFGVISDYDLVAAGNERYWVFKVPAGKYLITKIAVNNTTYGAGWYCMFVVLEV